jgi:hypothetical protein
MSHTASVPVIHGHTSVGHEAAAAHHEDLAPLDSLDEASAPVTDTAVEISTSVGVIVLNRHKIAKGTKAGTVTYLPDSFKSSEQLDALAELVGPENFYREVTKALKPFFLSAYEESKGADGLPEESNYVSKLVAEFQPHQRRAGGPTVRELIEKQAELVASAGELLAKIVDGTATDGEKHRASVIMLEFNTLAAQIEKKSRTKKAAKPAAAEPKH